MELIRAFGSPLPWRTGSSWKIERVTWLQSVIKLNLTHPYPAVHLLSPCYIILSHTELSGISLRESAGSHFISKRPCPQRVVFYTNSICVHIYEGKSMSGTTPSVSLSCCRAQRLSVCFPCVSGSTLVAGAGPAPRRRCKPRICTDHNHTG